MDLTDLREKLFATREGDKAFSLLHDRLYLKFRDTHRQEVLDILFEYAASGPVTFHRDMAMSDIAEMITPEDTDRIPELTAALDRPEVALWAVPALDAVAGEGAFATLVEFALDEGRELEHRAQAVRCLGLRTEQGFIRELPSDPGLWKPEQLPVEALRRWADAGFPRGEGLAPPPQHPALLNPQTEIDRLAFALEKRLAKLRAADQDPVHPTNWLTPADPADLLRIRERWQLPEIYLEFLEKFSPVAVTVTGKGFGFGTEVFGAADLIRAQDGYSFNSVTGNDIADWPRPYVVIGSKDGDPFVLDTGMTKKGDCPVLTAMHGQGAWEFEQFCARFTTFLRRMGS